MITTKLFIRDILKYCGGKTIFAVDGVPWLNKAIEEFTKI